jgi:hypothetical protein
MKAFIVLLGLVVLSIPLSASLVTVDPDGLVAGTDISMLFPYVTLSSGGGGANLDGKVSAAFQSGSTGNMVFANSRKSSKLWLNNDTDSCYYLRADFTIPTNHVKIDVIADSSGDRPSLWYYTLSGSIVKMDYQTSILSPYQIFTCTIDAAEITAVRVGGDGATSTNAVYLDNLRFEIPEPATCLILLSGALLMKRRKI